MKPPKDYAFVGEEAWKKIVAQRTADSWLVRITTYTLLLYFSFTSCVQLFWMQTLRKQ